MTVSEIIAALSRVQQIAGDLPVVFKEIESDAETVLQSIGVNIDPNSGAAGGSVTLQHSTAPAAPAAPPAEQAPAPAIDPEPAPPSPA